MVRRLARVLMIGRDLLLILMAVALMPTSYGKWFDEPVHYLLFYTAGILLVLSIVDLPLAAANVRRKTYFYFNSALQLLASVPLMVLGVGFILMILNIVIIFTLRRSRPQPVPVEGDPA